MQKVIMTMMPQRKWVSRMAKVHLCDICEQPVKDPYKAKMRTFYLGSEIDEHGVWPVPIKTFKKRVDICGECYAALKKGVKNVKEN